MKDWRLLPFAVGDGPWNMAVDEAVMQLVSAGSSPPTLRFYGWQPPCVSVGYNQRIMAELDLNTIRKMGFDLVRRPTGGRAVLHDRELTYSVIAPDSLLPGSVLETYRLLSLGIALGVEEWGLKLELTPYTRVRSRKRDNMNHSSAACFDAPSWYELTIKGKKVVGSAQVRRSGVVLQHGSIVIEFSAGTLASILKVENDDERPGFTALLEEKAAGLQGFTNSTLSPEGLSLVVSRGMERVLGVKLVRGGLSRQELELAQSIRDGKYLNPSWTFRR